MTGKRATPPMTCPECGYIATPAELRDRLRARRSFRCPGCGRELLPDSIVGMLVSLAAPGVAFALWWAAGLRGGWLALATVAAAPIAWWLMGVLLTIGWPPHLTPPRQPGPIRYIPGYHPTFGPRPIALGLSDPPPASPADSPRAEHRSGGQPGDADDA